MEKVQEKIVRLKRKYKRLETSAKLNAGYSKTSRMSFIEKITQQHKLKQELVKVKTSSPTQRSEESREPKAPVSDVIQLHRTICIACITLWTARRPISCIRPSVTKSTLSSSLM